VSRPRLYQRVQSLKFRFSAYGAFLVILHLISALLGAAAYAFSDLPVYLSATAAATSGYGATIMLQSVSTLVSLVLAIIAAILIFLSRPATARGEFSSSERLLHSAIAITCVAVALAAASLLPPARDMIARLQYYAYLGALSACACASAYALALLRAIVNYYAPRRK
jgi:hypothetical protein